MEERENNVIELNATEEVTPVVEVAQTTEPAMSGDFVKGAGVGVVVAAVGYGAYKLGRFIVKKIKIMKEKKAAAAAEAEEATEETEA